MLNTWNVCGELVHQLAFTKNCHRVFDRRFNGDKRYKIRVHACRGNCSHDEFLCSIGNIRLIVNVYRESDVHTGYYHETWYSVGLADSNWNEISGTQRVCVAQ